MAQLGKLENVYGKRKKEGWRSKRSHGKHRDSAVASPVGRPPVPRPQRPILLPTDFLGEKKPREAEIRTKKLPPGSPAPMDRTGAVDARIEDFSESDRAGNNN